MKEENWRQAVDAGALVLGKKRFSINDIAGWRDSYRGNPSSGSSGAGQLVFAQYTGGTQVLMGMQTSGSNLIPAGVRCCMSPGNSSACTGSSCVACGFTMGTGTYVALGSVGDCGATLWRRI